MMLTIEQLDTLRLWQGVLRSGFELNQAVGVLMAVHGVNAGTARDLLDQRAE